MHSQILPTLHIVPPPVEVMEVPPEHISFQVTHSAAEHVLQMIVDGVEYYCTNVGEETLDGVSCASFSPLSELYEIMTLPNGERYADVNGTRVYLARRSYNQ